MDRYDEKKEQHEAAEMERTGDVLGLGGSAVPKMPGDPSASNDPESVARRRERAREDETRLSDREDPYQPDARRDRNRHGLRRTRNGCERELGTNQLNT